MTKHAATALFGATIIGALVPSFVHVSGWWGGMVPEGMPWLAWVAALVIEGSLFAALYGMHRVKSGAPGRGWILGLLGLGFGASTYANLAWTLRAHAGAWGWMDALDALVGAALLPTYAVVAAHALPYVWKACEGRTASKRKAKREKSEPAPESSRKRKASAGKVDWSEVLEQGLLDHCETNTEAAELLGVHPSTVGRNVQRNGKGWVGV